MGKWISKDKSDRISDVMFKNFPDDPIAEFLRTKEFERYIPDMSGKSPEEIKDFMDYNLAIRLGNEIPELGKHIACLNPMFVESPDSIITNPKGIDVYTRVSEKENGYRMQLHLGPHPAITFALSIDGKRKMLRDVTAITRQFINYDLRMFPELWGALKRLPVMIGDAELINKNHTHMAGFNRLDERVARNWPNRETGKVPEDKLEKYFSRQKIFDENKWPTEDYELTLAFHGLFAISDPSTWEKSRKKQSEKMISLCKYPVNYYDVDCMLDLLADFIEKKEINSKVVERVQVFNKDELKDYIASKGVKALSKTEILEEDEGQEGLEGVVVVQYGEKNKEPVTEFSKSIKIKRYETIDCALLGLYLKKKADGLAQENLKGALLGLWDHEFECYLPVCKVNLDIDGPQITEQHQKDRLNDFNANLLDAVSELEEDPDSIKTLWDTYIKEAEIKSKHYLGIVPDDMNKFMNSIPKGSQFSKLLSRYNRNRKKYENTPKKSSTKADKWIHEHQRFLEAIADLKENYPSIQREVKAYLDLAGEIKSKKLVKPQYRISTENPLIIEAKVFGIKYLKNPMAAGFHSWYCDSFHFNNCYAERLRPDKITTEDYPRIQKIAKANSSDRKRIH